MGKDIHIPGITIEGPITVNGPAIEIHEIQNVNFNSHKKKPDEEKVVKEEVKQPAKVEHRDEELCQFIRPSVDDEQAWIYHDEIKRLVKRQGMQDICRYLNEMEKDNKLYLPIMPSAAYKELLRMGMPEDEGFGESNFRKFYRK